MNPYLPKIATITKIEKETFNINTYWFEVEGGSFQFEPGQFCIVGVPGVGESTFSIANSPTRNEHIMLSIMRTGAVTEKIHELKVGDKVTIRGPYGNGFPKDKLKGANLVYISGGVGLAAISNILMYTLDKRKDYGKIEIFNGARYHDWHLYHKTLLEWRKEPDVRVGLSIDNPHPTWKEDNGVVGVYIDPNFKNKSNILFGLDPKFQNTYVILSGPPLMIKFTLMGLDKIGFPKERVYSSLEARMNCGCGKCGRCNVGHQYVCQDGPVFTSAEIAAMPVVF